jgi:hypothetical protein
MDRLLHDVLADLSTAEAMGHIRWLTRHTPRRWSGRGDDAKAARYVLDRMSDYGLETALLEFETYNSTPLRSRLRVVEPLDLLIDSLPCGHIVATLPEGITVDLVDVGPGGEADYHGRDVRGKAVLVAVSYAPPTPEKARIAAAKGAVAMVCSNWGEDGQEVICHRALKAVWGTPTLTSLQEIPRLVGVSVSRQAGE